MVKKTIDIRVRYVETDQMGIVNNAHYPTYYEIGRTELFRALGISYSELEKQGVMLPVAETWIKYHTPAYYDDLLTIETFIAEMPASRIKFEYHIYNQNKQLVNQGYTILAFLNAQTRKPGRVPLIIENLLKPFFSN
jgi:acyl-CoA thioester hydrolase